ncbi:MAG: SDR family oxidoreductase [Propionibacterium sp.]|nr:SDR family oxidoreductase [Propionibacterium sp.]
MAENKHVVILGGHGKVALLAAPKFKQAGYTVDALIRNPDHSLAVEQAGANAVELDIEAATAEQMADAFKGADAVVFSAGAGGGNPVRTHAVDYEAAIRSMDAAERAGVQRYVMVSYASSEVDVERVEAGNKFYPYAKAKHDADAHLESTGLDHTILGPGMLTLEPASGRIRVAERGGLIDGRAPRDKEGETSRDNVAEVIVHAVVNNAGVRRRINFYDGDTPIADAIG